MTNLILIVDHVSKSLIVNHTNENVDLQLPAVRPAVHPLCTVEVVPNCNITKHSTIQSIH